MPGPSSAIPSGNVDNIFALRVPVAAGAALAAGTQERTYTVPGLLLGDAVSVVKPTFQNTISIGGARVSAVNTLAINFVVSSGTPTLTAEDYLLTVVRSTYDNPSVQLPTAIA
jgi:hypothetical protein